LIFSMTGRLPTASALGADISQWRVPSPFSVAETARRLERLLALNPAIRIIARVDQSQIAADAGGQMSPVVQLLFENVRFARQIVEADPEGAFNLPVKALIWQEETDAGEGVWLRTTDPDDLDPSPTVKSAFINEIAAILGTMIERTVDPLDPLLGSEE
jgi:uncharacterized protein (DUF302 family)